MASAGKYMFVSFRGETNIHVATVTTKSGGVDFADPAYRTITFLEPPTGDLLAWLQVNAVKQ